MNRQPRPDTAITFSLILLTVISSLGLGVFGLLLLGTPVGPPLFLGGVILFATAILLTGLNLSATAIIQALAPPPSPPNEQFKHIPSARENV